METLSAIKPKARNTQELKHALLTDEAKNFLLELHERFDERRRALLEARKSQQRAFSAGEQPDFLRETAHIRSDKNWQVAELPEILLDRRVEITGPVDRKMIINALNSKAKVFMADFEDASSPTIENMLDGQQNLFDAIRHQVDFTNEQGKSYTLNEQTATLKVRPRGLHLVEKHFEINERPIAASLFDFGLYFFHNAHELLRRGAGPYFYLPKLEHYKEAEWWNDVFEYAQEALGLQSGTIKATVLVETITAAYQMEEIVYSLRKHMAGLNAGRWDYLFSVIKQFRDRPEYILPDRVNLTMTVPFMKAYANLLVQVCHKRGAMAIGGMSAFIPSKDEETNKDALQKVRKDKTIEATAGYDGSWVAHPGLIDTVYEVFDDVLQGRKNQREEKRETLCVEAKDLCSFDDTFGVITEKGVRMNINVSLLYIEAWLQGQGAVALYNLMEDAATAEISRAQLWQWYHNHISFKNGKIFNRALFKRLVAEELEKVKAMLPQERLDTAKIDLAVILLEELVMDSDFEEFLTLKAYPFL
ncbi:malate synthase A [Marivirga atlantica]|jgi:malate synthase|uniref:malate synthase n=1 Tax=Marivirga atlantica TaxID=1548457 RepID=A0A937DIH1_9BACT|nr:malate synthase A [Marivirga atlantica]MBL0765005.1 malate synthase A [Marivirga atlantica]